MDAHKKVQNETVVDPFSFIKMSRLKWKWLPSFVRNPWETHTWFSEFTWIMFLTHLSGLKDLKLSNQQKYHQ